jgi:hypothetical protein
MSSVLQGHPYQPRATHVFSPKGATHTSPGYRPGFCIRKILSPERADDAVLSRPFRARTYVEPVTQGVALGWYEAGPSALQSRTLGP